MDNRDNAPDFDFPIFSECLICGEQVRTGERTGRTDFNSLRHYSQEHAIKAHSAAKFRVSDLVVSSWRQAKRDFEDGADVVVTEGTTDIPAFELRKVS